MPRKTQGPDATHHSTSPGDRIWQGLLILFALCGVLALFGPAMAGQQIFVFRDSATWHMPWLHWTSHQIQQGQIPLWNPQIGLGVNWVGQGTSTVLYPGTWLLALPVGDFAQRYATVLAAHVILSGVNLFLAARRIRCHSASAVLGGVAYAFSGPLLVQHANWPFLVSAAWLPLAVVGIWQSIGGQQHRLGTTILALSMIVLGGDPQAVMLLMLFGLVYLLAFRHRLSALSQSSTSGHSPQRWSPLALRWTILGCSIIACTLPQLAATIDAASKSDRVLERETTTSPASPTHSTQQILRYSQAPWTLLTLPYGNCLGTWRDYHRRWDMAFSAAEQPWNPTLYVGLVPFLLAVTTFRWKSGWSKRPGAPAGQLLMLRWLQSLVLFWGLASFGWYGLGWLLKEFGMNLGQMWRPETGGVYWFLQIVLPGFDQFRYPGKLWQFANVAICLLAAWHWNWLGGSQPTDRPVNRPDFPLQIGLLLTALLALIGFGIVIHPIGLHAIYQSLPMVRDPWLGDLRPNLAISDLQMALFQSVLVAALFWWILNGSPRVTQRTSRSLITPSRKTMLLTALVAVDLLVANRWLMMTTDPKCLNAGDQTVGLSEPGETPIRLYYDDPTFQQHRIAEMQRKWGAGAAGRPVAKLAWQSLQSMAASLQPQQQMWHLSYAVFNSDTTLRPAYRDAMDSTIRQQLLSLDEREQRLHRWQAFAERLGITHWTSPEFLQSRPGQPAVVRFQQTGASLEPWLATQWLVLKPPALTYHQLQADVMQVWWEPLSKGHAKSFVVLDGLPKNLPDSGDQNGQLTDYQPKSEQIVTQLSTPGLLCWNVAYDSGWYCEWKSPMTGQPVTGQQGTGQQGTGQQGIASALPVNRIQTGFVIPRGTNRCSLVYRPWWWTYGVPIAILSWLALAGYQWAGYRSATRKPSSADLTAS